MLLGSPHTTTHTILFFCVLKNPEKSLKVCGLPVFPQSSHGEGLGRGPVLIVTAYLPGWGWPPGPAALSMNAGRWWWPGTEGWVWWSLSSLLQTHRCREDIYKDISQSKYWVFNTPQLSCKPTSPSLCAEIPPHLSWSHHCGLRLSTLYLLLVCLSFRSCLAMSPGSRVYLVHSKVTSTVLS